MSDRFDPTPPPLPEVLRSKLADFRRRIWSTKTMEAAFAALFGLGLSYLLVFALDRFLETPALARLALLVGGAVGGVVFLPVQVARWVGGYRTLKQGAQRVAREDLATGDQLLSVLELTEDREEFSRSPELARAAIQQGERDLGGRDISHTLPRSRHRAWGSAAAVAIVATGAVFFSAPQAAANALGRWLNPLGDLERFTFTRLVDHTDHLVVARHEPFAFAVELADDTERSPETATLRLAGGAELTATQDSGTYAFDVPALAGEVEARLAVGDWFSELRIEPVDRPEASEVHASIGLPDYLELPAPLTKDVRAGSVGVVRGSRVSLEATVTRELSSATWSLAAAAVDGDRLRTEPFEVTESTESALSWRDVHGLEGTVPFELGLRSRDDAAPTVVLEGLPQDTILLHDQAKVFHVKSTDDFGVRKVGLEWVGVGEPEGDRQHAEGEKVLELGAPDRSSMESLATLHPKNLGIDPQLVRLRAWAIDALPGRERAYSAAIHVRVMTEDEHMIWLTRALARWYDEAVEVRDQEMALLDVNEELFELPESELATPANQRRIQNQAAAERQNGRRLSRLVEIGGEYLTEAARNPQFNSNTTDDWAEMMAALESIAANRMPSVAQLLDGAAEANAEGMANAATAPTAGTVRDGGKGGGEAAETELPNAPTVADVESSFNDPKDQEETEGGEPRKAPPANLTLPQTVVMGGGEDQEPQEDPGDDSADDTPSPTKEELAKAIEEQRALIEEFAKVAGIINEVLANLEGSTFVKRLKALSRSQTGTADDLDGTLVDTFGSDDALGNDDADVVTKVAKVQESSAQKASEVREDLSAYIERLDSHGKDTGKFQTVYDEMGEMAVARELTAVGDLAQDKFPGEAIAGAEHLADTLDRWAEQLVGPG